MKIVGACLARTATNSLKLALERLDGQPCYHMLETIEHPEHFPIRTRAIQGHAPDWRDFLAGYSAIVDEPGAFFWRELSAVFPEALILLSVRDTDEWWQSTIRTVIPAIRSLPPGPMKDLMQLMWSPEFCFDRYDESAAKAGYERYIENVRTHAPRRRLIEWHPGDGWSPICEALGVPVPNEPFPHVNTLAEFQRDTPDRLRRLHPTGDG